MKILWKTLIAVLLMTTYATATAIHVDLVRNTLSNDTRADIVLTSDEPVDIIGAQLGFIWDGSTTITGGTYVSSAIATWPGNDWNADLSDGNATYAWISFSPLSLSTSPTALGWVAFDGPSTELDFVADSRPPTEIVSADSNPPDLNLWDGVETSVTLPDPSTFLLLAVGGVFLWKRR